VRCFLYARVSMENVGTKEAPDEREQNPEAQLGPLRAECAKRDWKIVGEFIDRQTGTEMYRPEFKRMMEEVGRAQMIMVWRADRFSRFSPLEALVVVEELHTRGIGFYSLYEPFASDLPENTTPDDMRLFLLHLSFMNAKAESKRISERTKAGIAAKKADGTWKGGRPFGSKDSTPRGTPQQKVHLTPSDLFKPTA
jgi:DNA invertase Pin-like site-specific DNA recombinase